VRQRPHFLSAPRDAACRSRSTTTRPEPESTLLPRAPNRHGRVQGSRRPPYSRGTSRYLRPVELVDFTGTSAFRMSLLATSG
jgi:hypothetical protein